jgi:hypothetical protein
VFRFHRFAQQYWPVLVAASVAVAACGEETQSLEEAVGTEVAASAVTIPDGVSRFVEAQGTLCT